MPNSDSDPFRDAGDSGVTWITVAEAADSYLSARDIEALSNGIRAASNRGDQVVVLESGSMNFCLGRRPIETGSREEDRVSRQSVAESVRRLVTAIRSPGVVTLSSVRGQAQGIGWAIAELCDIVVASQSARFALPEIADGFPPLTVMSALMGCGRQHALFAVLSGEEIYADDTPSPYAAKVVPDEELEEAVERLAMHIASVNSNAVRRVLEFSRASDTSDARATLAASIFADFLNVT